jgi:beta-lactamase class A
VRAFAIVFAVAVLPGAVSLVQPDQQRSRMESEVAAITRPFRGQMGMAAVNLTSGETIAVDADARFPTASTIKTAVMVETWQQMADGQLALDTVVRLKDSDKVGGAGVLRGLHEGLDLTVADLIHLMIVLSDNTATNMLIARVGTARVNERLESYGLRQTKLFRPTFRDGRPDVLPDLEREFGLGMTTPREMARLMAMIAEGKAVSRAASEAMMSTLLRQQDRAMIPRLLPADDRIRIANKSGTDEEKHAQADGVKRHVRADAAIVSGPGFSYVIAIYARQVEDTRWTIDNEALTTGARISKVIYDHFSRSSGSGREP